MKFLSPDSKFAQFMTSVGEMMLLNACWILFSLPLVTMGTSNIAMYTLLGRRLRGEGAGTVVPFFRAWISNLKQGIPFWLAQVFMSCSLGLMLLIPVPVFMKVVAAVLLVLATLVFSLIYPQIARYRNRWFAYLRNALILLIAKPGRTLLNLLLFLFPAAIFFLAPEAFLQWGFIWILFGFSGLFYLSARIVQKILLPLEELSEDRPTVKITY